MVGLLRSIGKDFLEKCKNKELYIIRKGGRKRKTRKKTGNGHKLSKLKRRLTSRRIPAQVRVTPIEVVPPIGSIPVFEAQKVDAPLAKEVLSRKIKDAEVTTGTNSKGGKRRRKKTKKTRKRRRRKRKKRRRTRKKNKR